jgi:DNA-binding transcriptional MerR regulator
VPRLADIDFWCARAAADQNPPSSSFCLLADLPKLRTSTIRGFVGGSSLLTRAMARCGQCGHFASVHHGGGGGRPSGSSCAAPDCDCRKFVGTNEARVPFGDANLTAAEVAQLTGLSVHTLSYWRQSGQGPKTVKAGSRTLYRRQDVEQWLADVDGRAEPSPARSSDWFKKAVEAAERIEVAHTAPWKLASAYALLAIAEALLTQRTQKPTRTTSITNAAHPDGELLTVADVAVMTRLSVGTLRYWRHTGAGGPPSVKLGRRVLYRRSDIETWLRALRPLVVAGNRSNWAALRWLRTVIVPPLGAQDDTPLGGVSKC